MRKEFVCTERTGGSLIQKVHICCSHFGQFFQEKNHVVHIVPKWVHEHYNLVILESFKRESNFQNHKFPTSVLS